jgi:hypothetical protein
VPKLPNTGAGPEDKSNSLWNTVIPTIGTAVVLGSFYLVQRKRAV